MRSYYETNSSDLTATKDVVWRVDWNITVEPTNECQIKSNKKLRFSEKIYALSAAVVLLCFEIRTKL